MIPWNTLLSLGIASLCLLRCCILVSSHACLHVSVWVSLGGAHKGTPSISLAGVLAAHSPCTDEGVMQLVLAPQPCLPQPVLTLVAVHHWQVYLLEDHLVLPGCSKLVLAPASGKAGAATEFLLRSRQAGCVNMTGEDEVFRGEEDCPVIVEILGVELWVYVNATDSPVLVRVWLCLPLSVPLPAPHLQLCWAVPEPVHTVPCCQEHPWGYEGGTTLVEADGLLLTAAGPISLTHLPLHHLLMEDSTHVGPLAKLGLRLDKTLDPHAKSILVPPPALRLVLYLGRGRGDEVRVLAAHIKEARALAVLWSEHAKSIPDVNESRTVSDDGSIVALIVRHALVAQALGIVSAVSKLSVHLCGGLVPQREVGVLLYIVIWGLVVTLLENIYITIDSISMKLVVQSPSFNSFILCDSLIMAFRVPKNISNSIQSSNIKISRLS